MIINRRWIGTATAALLVATMTSTVPSGAHAAPANDVTTAVQQKLLAEAAVAADQAIRTADVADTRVDVTRKDGRGWAFGTAVLVAPQGEDLHPSGWLFVARQHRGGWQVAFEGEATFAELTTAAARSVVAEQERDTFTAPRTMAANGDFRTGMRLPFTVGQSWILRGGPHGWSGSPRPFSSIDLYGGDERVLAVRAGTAYTMCKGWIRVVHDRGYATDYYHLWNNISVDGASVWRVPSSATPAPTSPAAAPPAAGTCTWGCGRTARTWRSPPTTWASGCRERAVWPTRAPRCTARSA